MINACEVYLWGTRIGVVYQDDPFGAARFEYDMRFQNTGIELSPFRMPLSNRIYRFPELIRLDAFHGLPGLLADSLPDKFGNAVIDQWLLQHGRAQGSLSAIERLCYTGQRGMGALEYVPATGPEAHEADVDVTDMVRLASEILSKKEKASLNQHEANVAQLIEIGSSAGGARAKAVVAWNEKTGQIKSGQVKAGDGFEHWIIKFDGVTKNGDYNVNDKRQHSLIEYAYYLMATDLGIDMQECRILSKDGLDHFMTKRFDRVNDKKIHVQTLAALMHYDYNVPGECSYEMYAECAKRLRVGTDSIKQLYKRMVFNVVSGNCDDHVKNFSFLMDRNGTWSMSPAYDLTFAYNPDNKWISQHQMRVNNKTSDITDKDMLDCGATMGLTQDFCKGVLEQTKTVVSGWMDYAKQAGVSDDRAVEVQSGILRSLGRPF